MARRSRARFVIEHYRHGRSQGRDNSRDLTCIAFRTGDCFHLAVVSVAELAYTSSYALSHLRLRTKPLTKFRRTEEVSDFAAVHFTVVMSFRLQRRFFVGGRARRRRMLFHEAGLSAGAMEAAFRASSSTRNSRIFARFLFRCFLIRKKRAVSPHILDIDRLQSASTIRQTRSGCVMNFAASHLMTPVALPGIFALILARIPAILH